MRLPSKLAAPHFWGPGLLLVLFLLGALFLLKGRITGDGFSYYAWLRSPVFDGDFDFTNEYTTFNAGGYWTAVDETTPVGLKANPFAIGPAILWLPWFALAYALTAAFGGSLGLANDGYSFFYQFLIPFGSYCYACIGSLMLYRIVRRFVDAEAATLSLVSVLFASPLLNYLFNEPAASHPLSFFAISWLYWYWFRTRRFAADADNFLGGVLGGLVFLVRWQQVIFLLPILAEKLYRRRFFQLILFGSAFAMMAMWQSFAWKAVYDKFLTIPQTAGFFIPITDVLTWAARVPLLWFSPNHGLFYWHPLVLAGVAGLAWWAREKRRLALGFLGVFLLSSVVNSLVWEYYGGWAFGARRMIEALPLLAVGFGVFYQRPVVRRYGVWLLSAALVWNILLYAQYVVLRVDPTGPLRFPAWLAGQFTAFPAGFAKMIGQSVVFSNLYFGATEARVHYLLALIAALVIGLTFWLFRRFIPNKAP
jgi:hypothetical protein